MMQSIESLVVSGAFDQVAERVSGRFDCQVRTAEIRRWVDLLEANPIKLGWSDCTWFCFFKNRIPDRLPANSRPNDVRLTCEMHVFFIHIEESELHWRRLMLDDATIEQNYARSRLNPGLKTFVQPIDKTAFRVAPISIEDVCEDETEAVDV